MNIIEVINKQLRNDMHLAGLLESAKEYAQLYLLAKQRQKGCDEMGEVATVKDEFRSSLDKLIEYCKDKGYLSEDFSYDINTIANEIKRIPMYD